MVKGTNNFELQLERAKDIQRVVHMLTTEDISISSLIKIRTWSNFHFSKRLCNQTDMIYIWKII